MLYFSSAFFSLRPSSSSSYMTDHHSLVLVFIPAGGGWEWGAGGGLPRSAGVGKRYGVSCKSAWVWGDVFVCRVVFFLTGIVPSMPAAFGLTPYIYTHTLIGCCGAGRSSAGPRPLTSSPSSRYDFRPLSILSFFDDHSSPALTPRPPPPPKQPPNNRPSRSKGTSWR